MTSPNQIQSKACGVLSEGVERRKRGKEIRKENWKREKEEAKGKKK